MPAVESNEDIKELLASDEFVIMVDPSSHLVQGKGTQFSLTPSKLFLTNRHIFISPSVKNVDLEEIQLSDIKETKIQEINDCTVLTLLANDEINVFIPDPDQEHAFMEILNKLVSALENGQIDCDSLALSLQRRYIESETIASFYQTVSANKDNLVEQPMADTTPENLILNHYTPAPIRFIDVVVSLINMGDFFVFAILSTIVLFFSILFHFIPIGVLVCGLTAFIISRYGFQVIFSKKKHITNIKLPNSSNNPQIRSYIKSYETFSESFKKRILWRNPRSTLETVMFLISSATMFAFFDPAFVLMISMFGLSFVERWNPFGFGSPQEIISNLFTLS
ncbi:hypothetical protein M9Y10_012069 [Tritrichomonas musculus]|uniref:GRAM domain-containing protein n=1 Tax=Tritrichomonas musculus TaxID=1915356 RepID=A0ABR2ICM8_9EUKA